MSAATPTIDAADEIANLHDLVGTLSYVSAHVDNDARQLVAILGTSTDADWAGLDRDHLIHHLKELQGALNEFRGEALALFNGYHWLWTELGTALHGSSTSTAPDRIANNLDQLAVDRRQGEI